MAKLRYVILDLNSGQIFNGRTGQFQDQTFATGACIYGSKTKWRRGGGSATGPSDACEKNMDRLSQQFINDDSRKIETMEIDYLRKSVFAKKFKTFLDRHPSMA